MALGEIGLKIPFLIALPGPEDRFICSFCTTREGSQEVAGLLEDYIPVIPRNGWAERMLGYKKKEVIGHPEVFFRFYPPETAREMMRRMRSDEYGPRDKLNSIFHNIEVVTELDQELPEILGAPGQLQQVITNLLLNCQKPGGGASGLH